jgi:ABC-type phosphate/phosphonate transport system permease subunit
MPWDFSIIPVFIMFLIQFKPNIKAYWKGLFFAVTGTFLGEPLFMWLGFYVAENWSKVYSFPIYFFIYLACNKLSKVEKFEQIK